MKGRSCSHRAAGSPSRDRIARSVRDLMEIVHRIEEKGAGLGILAMNLDTTLPSSGYRAIRLRKDQGPAGDGRAGVEQPGIRTAQMPSGAMVEAQRLAAPRPVAFLQRDRAIRSGAVF